MTISTAALVIIVATIVLYAIDRLPMWLVSMMSITAMVLFGVLDLATAFKGFSSNLVMLVAGMMVIGNAMFENGVAEAIGKALFGRFAKNEKLFLMAVMLTAAVLSGFLHNTSVMVMMMPIISVYVAKSGGTLKTKNFYMALSQATIIGARITLVGSSPPMLAQNVLLESDGVARGFGFFEMSIVAIPTLLVVMLCYWLFIYRLGDKTFDHNDVPDQAVMEPMPEKAYVKWKTWLSGMVMLAVAVCFVFVKTIPLGIVSLTGAFILMVTGCADPKTSLKKLDWQTLVVLGASTGFAACFTASGLGDRIAELLTSETSGTSLAPAILVVIFCVLSAIITNVMANSASTIVFSTIAVSVALELGIDPIPLVMAVVCGGGAALILPTSTSTLTMSMAAGYKFRDYAVVGSIVSVICVTVSCVSIILAYGLL